MSCKNCKYSKCFHDLDEYGTTVTIFFCEHHRKPFIFRQVFGADIEFVAHCPCEKEP